MRIGVTGTPAARTDLNGGSATLDIKLVCLSLGSIFLMGSGTATMADKASKGVAVLGRQSGWYSEAGADSLLDSGTRTD